MTETEKRSHRACFTGHRPEKLAVPEREVIAGLKKEIEVAIENDLNVFISGMARGVDIWAAEIVLQLRDRGEDVKLICASPFEGFERSWSQEWRERYTAVMDKADLVRFICPSYSRACFQIRNEWMVDHAARVIAAWNGQSSGTKNTIDYARRNAIIVVNILDGR